MENYYTKKIVIMRHAKVLIKNRKIYANELKDAIEEYDVTSIDIYIKNKNELLNLSNSCNYFISSGLLRSVESLALLDKKADYIDKIFAEVESPYTRYKFIKLSLYTWGFWFKLVWFLGYSGGSKSYKESKKEAKEASEILIKLAKEHNSVFLLGHGIKNMLIAKALKKAGWSESTKMSSKNWGYGIYSKDNILHNVD